MLLQKKKKQFDGKTLKLENNIKKLQTFDSSYFKEDDGQDYLYFNQYADMLKQMENLSYLGNLKDYLTKLLRLILPLIIVLLH